MTVPDDNETVEAHVSLFYKAHSSVGTFLHDCDGYIIDMTAEVTGYVDLLGQSAQGTEVTLGELQFYIIRVGNAINDQVSLFDLFDTYQETHSMSAEIYTPSYNDFKKVIHNNFEAAYPGDDILLLRLLTIRPFARGQKLGLSVLEAVIRDWSSGCALVVMKPCPLQFAGASSPRKKGQSELSDFKLTERESFRRLRNYYGLLGFERIGKSDYYAICPNDKQPELPELPDLVLIPRSVIGEV